MRRDSDRQHMSGSHGSDDVKGYVVEDSTIDEPATLMVYRAEEKRQGGCRQQSGDQGASGEHDEFTALQVDRCHRYGGRQVLEVKILGAQEVDEELGDLVLIEEAISTSIGRSDAQESELCGEVDEALQWNPSSIETGNQTAHTCARQNAWLEVVFLQRL